MTSLILLVVALATVGAIAYFAKGEDKPSIF